MSEGIIRTYFKYVWGIGILRKVLPVIGLTTATGYIFFFAWINLGPEKPVLNYQRQQIANSAVKKILVELREKRGHIRSAVLVHFDNDPTDYFSHRLRNELNLCGILNLEDLYFTEKIKQLLNLPVRGKKSHQDALKYAKGADADGVLWGRIEALESYPEGSVCRGEWHLLELRSGAIVHSGVINESTISDDKKQIAALLKNVSELNKGSFLQHTASLLPGHIRFLIFLIFMLLFPIFTISFIKAILAKKSNQANAVMLGTYTLVDAIMAFFMIGGVFSTDLITLFFLMSTGLAFFYNAYIMCFALKIGGNKP